MTRPLCFVVCLALAGAPGVFAQTPPRLVPASGAVQDGTGAPRTGAALVTFAIYATQEGGDPLWQETQSLALDAAGRYSTLLGMTQPAGLPADLFSSGEARWLAVSVDGGAEGPRSFWASVPYALKAADAETIGGLPLEAFVINGAYRTADSAGAGRSIAADGDAGAGLAAPTDIGSPQDVVFADDVIVQGSICSGFDCINNEAFGFDTLRLKENNLQIHFEDTSIGTFPSNDWRIVINDSASGGANYFAVQDATADRVPFRIDAGAPAHSLRVSSAGRIGVRTASPVLDIHTDSSNTPAMRLEQNNGGGFVAQTWDIAGNEANFFVRDVTSGSRLPFRIFPGALTSSLVVGSNGNIGSGTSSTPAAAMELQRTSADVTLMLSNTAGQRWELKNNNATGRLTFGPIGGNVPLKFGPAAAENLLRIGILNNNTVDINGNLVVTGTCCAPDYVFEPEYKLRTLNELETYITDNKHLPGVPSADEISSNGLNLREMNYALLEKIEELVLYTLQQQKAIEELQQRLKALEAGKQ